MPADLRSRVRELEAAVSAGVLEQVRPDPSPFATGTELAGLADRGPWPDYIEMRFRVRDTALRYKLAVETFHGAGGTWAPE